METQNSRPKVEVTLLPPYTRGDMLKWDWITDEVKSELVDALYSNIDAEQGVSMEDTSDLTEYNNIEI